jgi:hypothetical protein
MVAVHRPGSRSTCTARPRRRGHHRPSSWGTSTSGMASGCRASWTSVVSAHDRDLDQPVAARALSGFSAGSYTLRTWPLADRDSRLPVTCRLPRHPHGVPWPGSPNVRSAAIHSTVRAAGRFKCRAMVDQTAASSWGSRRRLFGRGVGGASPTIPSFREPVAPCLRAPRWSIRPRDHLPVEE